MTITREEIDGWQKDIHKAEQTHPNSFANAPFIRSFFKISQNMDVVGQYIGHLTSATRGINSSLENFKKVVEENNRNTENLSKKIFWLNVVLALATLLGAAATILLVFKK